MSKNHKTSDWCVCYHLSSLSKYWMSGRPASVVEATVAGGCWQASHLCPAAEEYISYLAGLESSDHNWIHFHIRDSVTQCPIWGVRCEPSVGWWLPVTVTMTGVMDPQPTPPISSLVSGPSSSDNLRWSGNNNDVDIDQPAAARETTGGCLLPHSEIN